MFGFGRRRSDRGRARRTRAACTRRDGASRSGSSIGRTAGGLAASITVDGQRVDLGSHRLHPSIRRDLLDDLRGLLGDELQLRPRNGRIRLDGRWVAFLRPADLATAARLRSSGAGRHRLGAAAPAAC